MKLKKADIVDSVKDHTGQFIFYASLKENNRKEKKLC